MEIYVKRGCCSGIIDEATYGNVFSDLFVIEKLCHIMIACFRVFFFFFL